MSLSATLFGRDSFIHRATNILGLGLPSWLDKKFGPPDVLGPRLSDLSVQTSAYGAEIPRVYGGVSIAGNLVWLENNRLKETSHKKKSGGKGGGSAKPTKTWTYSASFMLALCEGPISAIGRIWCSDKLIYNPQSDDIGTIIESNRAAVGIRFYYGTDSQRPDSRMEAALGVGNVPAYRGLAYLVFDDFQLADFGNTLQGSNFKVEVFQSAANGNGKFLVGSDITPTYTNFRTNGTIALNDQGEVEVMTWDGSGGAGGGGVPGMVYSTNTFGASKITGTRNALSILASSTKMQGSDILDFTQAYDNIAVTSPIPGTAARLRVFDSYALGAHKFLEVAPVSTNDNIFIHGYGGKLYWFNNRDGGQATLPSYCGYCEAIPQLAGSVTPDPPYPEVFEMPATSSLWALSEGHAFALVAEGGVTAIWEYDLNGMVLVKKHPRLSAPHVTPKPWGACVDKGIHWTFRSGGNVNGVESMQFNRVNIATGELRIITVPREVRDYGAIQWVIFVTGDILYMQMFGAKTPSSSPRAAIHLEILRVSGTEGTSLPLADILAKECSYSGMVQASDLITSDIPDRVRGYRVEGGSVRKALEPLQTAFPFDVVSSGYKIKFVRRGKGPTAVIPYEHLGATATGSAVDIISNTREQDSQLPAKITVDYLDGTREYSVGEQYYEKLNPSTINAKSVELAIVLSADEAAKIAEILTLTPWLEKRSYSFTLPLSYSYLEPGDVITLNTATVSHELHIVKIGTDSDGKLTIAANPNRASLFAPVSKGAAAVPPVGTIPYRGATDLIVLDIPTIDETIQNTPGFVAVASSAASSWPGANLVSSQDSGQNYTDLSPIEGIGTYGICLNTQLPISDCTLIDTRVLRVTMVSGTLESITRDQMLSGQQYAAYGINGRFEIVRFQTATLVSAGVYDISGFVRGEKGTEWATSGHAVLDMFVLLTDPDNVFIDQPIANLNSPQLIKAITAGATLESAANVAFTYAGVNLECLSPVYPTSRRDTSGNLSFSVQRRSRLSSSWWSNGMEAPVGETTLAFEADIISAGNVRRTIPSSTGAFVYSAADQVADFGTAQATVTVRIYQLSTVVGRGYPLQVNV